MLATLSNGPTGSIINALWALLSADLHTCSETKTKTYNPPNVLLIHNIAYDQLNTALMI